MTLMRKRIINPKCLLHVPHWGSSPSPRESNHVTPWLMGLCSATGPRWQGPLILKITVSPVQIYDDVS